MPYIDVIRPEEAEGELLSIYDRLIKTRGKLAEVHMIQSLNPKSIVAHMDLYLTIMFSKSPLSRAQREMMAVVVSSFNECEYCQRHHAEALNHYWKSRPRIEELKLDFRRLNLNKQDLALCSYARYLTLNPSLIQIDFIDQLRSCGLDDRSILDATLVISYFNFVNRIVLALGVETDDEEATGYQY